MAVFEAVRHVSITIDRSVQDVYEFIANPENLPRWAAGLSSGIRRAEGGEREWVAESPMGSVTVRFAVRNSFGILDHEVVLPSGLVVYNPMRVIANLTGSEVIFTLFKRTEMSEQEFIADAAAVTRDLARLKTLLESA